MIIALAAFPSLESVGVQDEDRLIVCTEISTSGHITILVESAWRNFLSFRLVQVQFNLIVYWLCALFTNVSVAAQCYDVTKVVGNPTLQAWQLRVSWILFMRLSGAICILVFPVIPVICLFCKLSSISFIFKGCCPNLPTKNLATSFGGNQCGNIKLRKYIRVC